MPPLKTGIKTIQESDYDEISAEVKYLQDIHELLRKNAPAVRVDVGHRHKYWEWGRILRVLKDYESYEGNISVLDIGAAYSLLGPALAMRSMNVVEAEPDPDCVAERAKLNDYMVTLPEPRRINCIPVGYRNLPPMLYDAVLSVSVMEHVDLSAELFAWGEMASRVKLGGLLAVTMDCMPRPGRGFVADSVRCTNYTMADVKRRVEHLRSLGFEPVGEADYTYHGNQVADYSFASIIMQKFRGHLAEANIKRNA